MKTQLTRIHVHIVNVSNAIAMGRVYAVTSKNVLQDCIA